MLREISDKKPIKRRNYLLVDCINKTKMIKTDDMKASGGKLNKTCHCHRLKEEKMSFQ